MELSRGAVRERKKLLDNQQSMHYTDFRCKRNGGIAQLARAFGSYPECHLFESDCRYQTYGGYLP